MTLVRYPVERLYFLTLPAVILLVYKSYAAAQDYWEIFDVLCPSVFLGFFSGPYTVERSEVLCHDPASPYYFPAQILQGSIF